LAAAYVVNVPAKTGKKQKTAPNIVRIGDELIRYSKTEGKDPITLVGCRRGYAGTKAAAHGKGDAVAKLLTHKRGVVFPNIRLLPEIAVNLGRSLKLTGIRSLSFDGLEGTDATGHGGYAQALFTYTVWKAINDDEFIASSSRAGEYFWYLNSHQTWGEPHGKGFRHDKAYYEGKIAGRIERILVPNYIAFRLGQYKFRNLSRITDIEWLLTKCAALDGGFDLYITPEEYAAAGDFGKEVMATISLWEEARMQRVFTPEQRKVMGEFETVFRLTKDDTGKFAVIRLGPEEAKEVIDPVLGDPKTKDREKSVELFH
jgi:hypothetical protein